MRKLVDAHLHSSWEELDGVSPFLDQQCTDGAKLEGEAGETMDATDGGARDSVEAGSAVRFLHAGLGICSLHGRFLLSMGGWNLFVFSAA